MDSIAHHGLPIFQESKILFKSNAVDERTKQTIALLIGKTFSEFVKLFFLIENF